MGIRKFSISDLDQVLEIENLSFPNPYPRFYFERLYQDYPESFLVAEKTTTHPPHPPAPKARAPGEILGYVIGRERENGGEIVTIAVKPIWRKRKIGQSLANSLINYFQKRGLKEIFLHVRISNRVGILFHQSLGFEILEKIENYYPDGEAAYLMKKEI